MSIALTITSDHKYYSISFDIKFEVMEDYIKQIKYLTYDHISLSINHSDQSPLPKNIKIKNIDVTIEEKINKKTISHHFLFYFWNDKEKQKKEIFYQETNSININIEKGTKIPRLKINTLTANSHYSRQDENCSII